MPAVPFGFRINTPPSLNKSRENLPQHFQARLLQLCHPYRGHSRLPWLAYRRPWELKEHVPP
ncbi:hypothetical protein EYF80_067754 [Liparis tanakae]|uniref:Uncharacterized protein n=1 Tax=Liparis tanakae TaxID=230148 RepID=A0A4Z2E173_9TELE|nr:hypothetical protein EYF80_067754 [Liparis tanakae]